MNEKAVVFGAEQSLVGIVTNSGREKPAVGIILLNSGLLHRVGPNRLYVRIARSLAEDGFTCLRFDLSGIGDSKPPVDPNYDDVTGAISDIQQAMDYLSTSKGIQQFVLMGLCSGADNAFRAACDDDRVIAVVMLEAFSFPTDSYFVNAYKRSLFSPRSWIRFLSGKSEIWGLLKARLTFHTSGTKELTANLQVPPKNEVVRDFGRLIGRGVRLCFIYALGGAGDYHYQRLLKEAVEQTNENIKPAVKFIADSDHLFTMSYHQGQVLSEVRNWLRTLSQSTDEPAQVLND